MKFKLSYSMKISGMVLVVLSVAMLPPVLVCMFYGEYHVASAFAHSIWICALIGATLFVLSRHVNPQPQVRDGFLMLTVAWVTASIFGILPYFYSDTLTDLTEAFFESASGFSTTGATVFSDVESVPNGIILWRSITSWLGGLSILVFAVALMPSLGVNGTSVAEPDKPSLRIDAITPKAKRIASAIVLGYFLLTVAEALMLTIGGMGLFDAAIHSLSTVSTGGFSNYNDGVMHFDSIYIRIVIMVFMIIAGTNCTMLYSFSRRGIKAFTEDTEFKAYWIIMFCAFILVFAKLFFAKTGWSHGGEAANSAFQVISMLTTTGFVSDNFAAWPAFCQMILILLMFIGGCSSSSSSGNKVARFVVVLKLVLHGIQTRLHSNIVKPVKLNGKDVPNDTVSAVSNHMFLFVVMTFAVAFILSFEDMDMLDCFASAISLLSNIGPCFGSAGIRSNFGDFTGFAKAIMGFIMIAGRLELYTVLILFTPGFWRKN